MKTLSVSLFVLRYHSVLPLPQSLSPAFSLESFGTTKKKKKKTFLSVTRDQGQSIMLGEAEGGRGESGLTGSRVKKGLTSFLTIQNSTVSEVVTVTDGTRGQRI